MKKENRKTEGLAVLLFISDKTLDATFCGNNA